MRIEIPDDIKALTNVFAPFMVMDEETKMLVLKDDAPAEAKDAREKYHSWWLEHHRQP